MALGLAFIIMSPMDAYAVPANPFAFVFQQADDSEIILNFRGDEFFAWWEDESGFIVAFDEASGNWRYANVVEGIISPAGPIAGRFDDAAAGFARIERAALLPLIANAWRFDPGYPMVEFFGGQVLVDHRTPALVPVPTPRPTNPIINITPIQPGQTITPPTIPTIPNVFQPALPATPPSTTQPSGPPPATPTPAPGGDGGGDVGIGGMGSILGGGGFSASINTPLASPLFSAAHGSATAPHMQTNQRLLVLLVEFDNMPMLRDSAFYHNKYFNTAPGAISVANYFRDMSGGHNIFVPAGNVVDGGTFRVSLPEADFAWATNGVDVTITPSVHNGIVSARVHMDHPVTAWSSPVGHQSVRDTVSLVLAAIHENTNFDFNGVHVGAVFAGGEASDNYNPGGHVWGHAWQFRGSVVGQTGWPRYMAYGERQRGGHIVGIGLAVHELGHVLGLPDLYDLSGQSEGVGPYSLMAFGSWGRGPQDAAAGHRPTAFDPWSLIQLGYARPTVISSGTWRGNVNSLNTDNYNILMITSPAGPSQYFLVENRQMDSTWDAGLNQWITNPNSPGGIMVFHVDDAVRSANPGDMSRNNNNRHHMLVDVREADGSGLLGSSVVNWATMNDHFFSGNNFSQFGADTNPNSHFYSGTGQPGSRNLATGIEMIVHGTHGDVMEVEIILSQSGGATAPVIGIGGQGSANAPAAPMQAAMAPQAAVTLQIDEEGLNHARVRNQLLLNVDVPTLTLPANIAEIMLLGETLDLLVANMSQLAISTQTHTIVFPDVLLAEMRAAGGESFVVSIVGTNVTKSSQGQVLANLNNIYHVFGI